MWWRFDLLMIVYTGSETGCIWLDILEIRLDVNRWVKEMRNNDRRCKPTLYSFLTRVQMYSLT
jgi:hypothetical protein